MSVAHGGEETGRRFEQLRTLADAILYEGYLLYPYRKSSGKNRVRWQFGILAPREWAERNGPVAEGIAGSVESWQQQTECLFEQTARNPSDVTLRLRIRYLQMQAKRVEQRAEDGRYVPVESIDIGQQTHLSFEEATAQERDITVSLADVLDSARPFEVGACEGSEVEELAGGAARIVRQRWPVAAKTLLRAERTDPGSPVYRLRVRTENTGSQADTETPRNAALRHSLIATHALLGGSGLSYLSLIDPPGWATEQVPACRNVHTFPVLAGEVAVTTGATMLSSPILLYDDPQIAPESPGDLHDSGEIDEILTLRTLTLTDEEQREARATDPRAAEILDRAHDMPDEVLAKLHGAVRSLEPTTNPETTQGGI